MSSEELSREDVAAMRREGDLKAFLRQGIRQGQGVHRAGVRQFQQRATQPADLPESTGHTPGAWPAGTTGNGTTCDCTRCRSYAQDQPTADELVRRAEEYLTRTEGTE